MLFMKNYLILSLALLLIACKKKNDLDPLSKLVKRIDNSEDLVKKAKDYIVNDNIYVWDLWEPVVYKDSINWHSDPFKSKSWYLYFQSLRMVGYLAEDYKFSNDSLNILKANEIIRSWYKQHKKDFLVEDNSTLSKRVWNDHATANRVLNLMHVYFTFSKDVELRVLIKKILYHHGLWLANQKNYTQGNHAVMIDRSLFQLSKLFTFAQSYQWQELSKTRLKEIFNKEVTKEGVCTENSAFYHFYVLDLLRDILNLFKSYDIEYSQDWDSMIAKMKAFGDQLLKPNNTMPTIGDTYHSIYPVNLFQKYNDSTYLFNSSLGKKGTKPIYVDKVYKNSGYAFFKEKLTQIDSSNYSNRTYLSFINTNLSKVHKHNDFLSLTFSSNNEDLIIDAGHISYEKNKLTNYIRSTFAHSGITINNRNFNFKEISLDQITISDHEIKDDYSFVQGSFEVNEMTSLLRSILFFGVNTVLIYDKLITREKVESFSQIFNLGNNFDKLEQVSDNEVLLYFKNNNLKITQINHSKQLKYELFKSDYKKGNLEGIRANGYGKVLDGSLLKFNNDVEKNQLINELSYITLLSVQNSRFIEAEINIKNNLNEIIVTERGNIIKKLKK
tara:strand:- start:7418 stop:9253 length:1836 start_codon:yes stop_codon:yes gene_type:complete